MKKTNLMFKNLKKILSLITFSIFFCLTPVFASNIADDAKKALKEYAGYKELLNRGFKLNMLDKIQTPEDLYNVLLPYMIIDGKPLDNDLAFNGYSFARHKTIKFEDVYGTIGELTGKGYKPEQLFYYPCKGKNIYRVGKFVWEKPIAVSYPWTGVCFYNRPFTGSKVAYFFPGAFTDNYFKPYIKDISKKDSIIVDCRLLKNGWGGQIYKLGESLCSSNYKGKVILIIDSTTGSGIENEIINNMRDSYSVNGSMKKVSFEWITVGENTSGTQLYVNNAKWGYNLGELQFNPLPVNKNQWACCEEGEGVAPNIWAIGDDDINKTIEILTGENNFAELIKDVSEWRNYLCSSDKALWNFQLAIPESVKKIKSNNEYNKTIAEILKTQLKYMTILKDNNDKLMNIGWWFESPSCAEKTKDVQVYTAAYIKNTESRIKWINYLVKNKEILSQSNYGFEYPEVFKNCNSYAVYAECFEKWIDARIKWCDLFVRNLNGMNNNPTWWEVPEFLKSFKTAEQYTDYFCRWLGLRTWWCGIILDNEYVFKNNNIRTWNDALKEEIKEWKDPEKHLAELTAYLEETAKWVEYLKPHPYIIPKDMGMAKLYGNMRVTSNKIGSNCSAVPTEITSIRKTNPAEYVDKMVEYINSVAENDFEKVKMVFDIEQEILTYDHERYRQMLSKIDEARKGVGEDYKLYQKNLNTLYNKERDAKKEEDKSAKQDWKSVLERDSCVCQGYSELMQYFCYKLGIKCDVISTADDMIFAVGHAWNIVEINGEHYLLDATWGRSYLFMDPDFSVKGGHFPKESDQQLLKTPMTLDEYKKLKNYSGNKS